MFLGRNRDVHDHRDNLLYFPSTNVPLPNSVDTFQGLSLPIFNQGDLGSCTGNAGTLYRRFLAQRFPKYSAPDQDLSRLFLYYQERKLDGTISEDAGAQMRDVCRVLAKTGICPEADDPYNITAFADPINDSPQSLSDAARYKIGAYHRITNVNGIRSCIASGYPVLLGFTVYSSFESIGSDGIMPMPVNEEPIGGHAVVIRGYDDLTELFLVQNSWGADWGLSGCFKMPYKFLENVDLSQPDFWMCHLGKPW